MRIIVTGSRGMLGSEFAQMHSPFETISLLREDLDLLNVDAVKRFIEPHDVIVNCAAYTRVDEAETHEAEALEVNAVVVENLAIAARDRDARLISISTDYVFDGRATAPYSEATTRSPISAYGRSKAAGEARALSAHPQGTTIVRTAWLYGKNGPNFAQTMLNLAASRESWTVVDDQHGQPTWTRDLAEQIINLIDAGVPSGIFHGTNSGETTWYGFARAVLEEAGLDPERITPTDSSTFVRPAPRPAYSVLGHVRWNEVGLRPMRPWREALHEAFEVGTFHL